MAYHFYDPFNSAYISYNELYDPRQHTMSFPMDADEIPVENPYQEPRYYNQVPFYYNEDHDRRYDRRDYDRNERNFREIYVQEQTPFSMDTEEYYEISVPIQLSSTRNVNSMIDRLHRDYDLQCSLSRNVLTVTGYGSNHRNCQTDFLNYVREIDRGACLAYRR